MNLELANEWNRQQVKELPENLEEQLLASVAGASGATRSLSGTGDAENFRIDSGIYRRFCGSFPVDQYMD